MACGPSTRLIPAHAGKTSARSARVRPRAAHPRSRGENAEGGVEYTVRDGSSPLKRGKHRPVTVCSSVRRLIPAHAGKTRTRGPAHLSTGAHPRSRGENLIGVAADLSAQGSSPLTRGKRRCGHGLGLRGRLIPAHAGKTSTTRPSRPSEGAHPRSRGENEVRHVCERAARGSSPLTRGKQRRVSGANLAHRLIPAHAGKTRRSRSGTTPERAHPRSRGENVE